MSCDSARGRDEIARVASKATISDLCRRLDIGCEEGINHQRFG